MRRSKEPARSGVRAPAVSRVAVAGLLFALLLVSVPAPSAAGRAGGPHALAAAETPPAPSLLPYGVWTNANPPSHPFISLGEADWITMAYSPDADRFLLLTANQMGPEQAWVYDAGANRWTAVPTPSPSPAIWPGASLVYDDAVHRFVLFGASGAQPFGGAYGANETWLFDLSTDAWTNATPPVSPRARWAQAMVYVPDTGTVVLFGGQYVTCLPQGCNAGGQGWSLNDTWVYDATADTWTNVTPAGSPGEDWGPQMAYDPVSRKVFLAKGSDATSWLYDPLANTWQQTGVASSGGMDLAFSAVAYDASVDAVVAFGGMPQSTLSNETWWFNRTTGGWVRAPSLNAPSPREESAMAYDNRTGDLVLYGGFDSYGQLTDTWLYRPATPPSFSVTATAGPLEGPAPLVVGFEAKPAGGVPPYAFLWDFGDGSRAWVASPTHAFEAPGHYTVRLTIRDAAQNATTVDLQVSAGPRSPSSLAQPLSVSLAVSIGIVAAGGVAAVATYVLLKPRPPRRP